MGINCLDVVMVVSQWWGFVIYIFFLGEIFGNCLQLYS